MNDTCNICGKPLATEDDYRRIQEGEGDHLCWSEYGSPCDVDVYEALAQCRSELATLRAMLTPITRIEATPKHVEITLEMHAEIAHRFGNMMVAILRDAPNYQEMTMTAENGGEEYVVTVRRSDGKTPHQLREEAERKLVTATALLAECRELIAELVAVSKCHCFDGSEPRQRHAANSICHLHEPAKKLLAKLEDVK